MDEKGANGYNAQIRILTYGTHSFCLDSLMMLGVGEVDTDPT